MGTVTYKPDDPEAKAFEDLRKANEESTRAARAKQIEPLPDRVSNKPQKE